MSGEKSFDLTKVHEVNLKLLKEIDRICRKYKIKYALDSGTLLGAVRHGGFIPWDDDVDVMFTRKNYEMFAKVVRRELPEDMSFVEPNEYHGGKAFYDFISRVTYNSIFSANLAVSSVSGLEWNKWIMHFNNSAPLIAIDTCTAHPSSSFDVASIRNDFVSLLFNTEMAACLRYS